MLFTAATIGLVLAATGTVLTGVRTFIQHRDSKKSREVIQKSADRIVKGQNNIMMASRALGQKMNEISNKTNEISQKVNEINEKTNEINRSVNVILETEREIKHLIIENSKTQPFNDLFAGYEYLNQASLCVSEKTAMELVKCAHNHFTDGLVGISRISELTNEERDSVCQAMVGDAMCCYYLKEPVLACKRLYDSILYRPEAYASNEYCDQKGLEGQALVLALALAFKSKFNPTSHNTQNDELRNKIKDTTEAVSTIKKEFSDADYSSISKEEIKVALVIMHLAVKQTSGPQGLVH